MKPLYTTAQVPIDQIKLIQKNVSPNCRSLQSTVPQFPELGTTPPIIISKNFWLLNGHKTLATIRSKRPKDTSIDVIVFQRDLSFEQAEQMYWILNNKLISAKKSTDIGLNRDHSPITLEQLSEKAKILCNPIKTFYRLRMLLQNLRDAPLDLQGSITDALAHSILPRQD